MNLGKISLIINTIFTQIWLSASCLAYWLESLELEEASSLHPFCIFKIFSHQKKISAFSSIFILVNSIAGLLGQFYKNFNTEIDLDFNEYSFLMIAVILGGQIGNYFGVKIFSGLIVRRLTSVLVIYVGIRLIINI